MTKRISIGLVVVVVALVVLTWLFRVPSVTSQPIETSEASVQRGAYLINAGGCISCHEGQEAEGLSGGMALASEFGTFYAPNITPDRDTGIGGWEAKDFLLALKHGRGPEGQFYFPAFPYRAYAGMTDQDVLDIGAYLLSLEPVVNRVPPHDTPVWLQRWMLAGWNVMADLAGDATPVLSEDPDVLRGSYLARNLGHCGECHTPRNALGIPMLDQEFAGATLGESHADAIDAEGLLNWSADDFAFFLFLGMKEDGEYIGGEMESVIEHNTAMLTEEDRNALAAFFKRPR